MGKRKDFLSVEVVTVLKQKGVELSTPSVRLLHPLSVVITCCGANVAFHKNGMPVWDKPECLLWY